MWTLIMIVFIVIPIAIGFWASHRVKKTYEKYAQTNAMSGMPGYKVARIILDNAGLPDIGIEQVVGELSDHYDPGAKTVRLSESTYYSTSIAALGVVAHECGHAVQDSRNYAMMVARATLVPIANIGTGIAPFILMGGAILVATTLGKLMLMIGIGFLTGYVIFTLVTLPVEFDASARAMRIMADQGVLTSQELPMAKEVLDAAAFTYVAAAVSAIMTLIYYIMLLLRGNQE